MNVAQFLKVQINLFFSRTVVENRNFLIILEISYYFEVFSKKPEIFHKKRIRELKILQIRACSRLIQLMSGDSDLTSVGPGTPCGAAQSTLSKSHSACIHARDLQFEIYSSHCNSRQSEKCFDFLQCFHCVELGPFLCHGS